MLLKSTQLLTKNKTPLKQAFIQTVSGHLNLNIMSKLSKVLITIGTIDRTLFFVSSDSWK